MSAAPFTLRPLAATDSIEALTALLHRAYAGLGAMGLNYTAVDQGVEVTRRRAHSGHCIVAEQGGQVVGTVTVGGAWDVESLPDARDCAWYLRRDIAHLHQLGVEPRMHGRGIGTALVAACEQWARERRFGGIALDTAMPAEHLRQRYARLGYAEVDSMQWRGKRYRTVVMVKALAGAAPATSDAEHRVALVRALWAHVQARDWAAMRGAFDPQAVMHWPCSDERLDGAETIVRVNAEYPEGWSIRQREVEALADVDGRSRVRSVIDLEHGAQRFYANSCFAFEGTRIVHAVEHWATVEAPPAWRTRERLGPGYAAGVRWQA